MKKLFMTNPYLTECKAKVKRINGKELYLDQSCFFAFSGGQASDKGTVAGIEVSEAIDEKDNIKYVLSKDPHLEIGDEVDVKIDWEHRFRIMRLHAAAHIVYEIAKNIIGEKKLIGSNVYENKARLDYEMDDTLTGSMQKIQEDLDDFLEFDREIMRYPDDQKDNFWWWTISNFSKMPCGGTHPNSTKEIGKVQIKRRNLGKGKERIEITLDDPDIVGFKK